MRCGEGRGKPGKKGREMFTISLEVTADVLDWVVFELFNVGFCGRANANVRYGFDKRKGKGKLRTSQLHIRQHNILTNTVQRPRTLKERLVRILLRNNRQETDRFAHKLKKSKNQKQRINYPSENHYPKLNKNSPNHSSAPAPTQQPTSKPPQ